MIYGLVFVAALATAVLMVPVAQRLSFRLNLVDRPGGRRRHKGLIPRLGGLPIMAGYLVGIVLIDWLLPPTSAGDILRLRGVVLGSVVMFLGGLLDDRYDLAPRWQFVFQFAGLGIAMGHDVFIERISDPLGNPAFWTSAPLSWLFRYDLAESLVIFETPLVFLLTLLWIVGMINAVNWLDGLDGLAAGVGAVAALLFAWHSYRLEQVTVPLFPLALAGALLGFLFFNFAPARIFLGTAGAWLLGYNLATLSILSPAKLSTALLVMAVPILDVAWQIFDRIRRGKNPYQGDRGHLHFRLQDRGLPVRRIVLGYYAVACAFGLVAVLVSNRLLKIGLWLVLGTAVLGLLIWLTRRSPTL